jgi:uncharacterized protein YqfB (UPF0267 family)
MLISFAWTTAPLLAGAKTMTWRDWSADFAQRFRPGDQVQAWDKNPRNHGQHVADIRIVSVRCIHADELADEDYAAEGLEWMAQHPESWPKTIFGEKFRPYHVSRERFDAFRRSGETGYCVRFDQVEVLG